MNNFQSRNGLRRLWSIATFATALLHLQPARAALVVTEQKILVADELTYGLGGTVAIDGNTVAATGVAGTVYAVFVFVRNPTTGTWTQQAKLLPSDPAIASDFGDALAVSGDTIIAGDRLQRSNLGAAYVFVRSTNGTWTQQQKLTPEFAGVGALAGASVAVSGDLALIGAIGQNSWTGAAFIYKRDPSTQYWGLSNGSLGTNVPNAAFGNVALDGTTAIVGAPGAGTGLAHAILFDDYPATLRWMEQMPPLVGNDTATSEYFGSGVAVSGDTAVVGASGAAGGAGAAYAFVRDRMTQTWSQQEKLVPIAAGVSLSGFGERVGVSGNLAVASAAFTSSDGVAFVFARDAATGRWPLQARLTRSDGVANGLFGRDIGVSGDTVIVGASGRNENVGAVYVYTVRKGNGDPCASGSECASNQCHQGVCCATACTGTCKSCALSGSLGTCTNVPSGQDPLSQCSDNGTASCGTDGVCNGAGACHLYSSTTQCAAASCSGATYSSARICSGSGVCQTATTTSCAPYGCGAGVCRTSCASNADCMSPNVCQNGICGKTNGSTCSTGGECASTICAQGVCCSTACSGTCKSCALNGALGTCSNVPDGQDPLSQCSDNGAASCGTDGMCNGSGACRLYGAGIQCAAAACSGITLTQARTCDGAGVCRAASTSQCAPFRCGVGACASTCNADSDCVSPNSCVNHSCGKKPDGTVCTGGTECESGACSQGVCCKTDCTGTCKSCAVSGSLGTCTNVPDGQDPLDQCADSGAATCKADGQCNGAGACRQYAQGTTCAAETCSGAMHTPARICDGVGNCGAASSDSCSGYTCASATSCRTNCSSATDCVAPFTCDGNHCVTIDAGSPDADGPDAGGPDVGGDADTADGSSLPDAPAGADGTTIADVGGEVPGKVLKGCECTAAATGGDQLFGVTLAAFALLLTLRRRRSAPSRS